MSWLGQKRERREVEPNGHGEATRGHELDLHELASVSSTMVIPYFVPLD
jgi:hypothetical protein